MADLDEIDYGILHLLQEDARNRTPGDMAEHLPVSGQTVRNRIGKLEDQGVIEGYVPIINYEKAGFPIRLQFSCTAPPRRRQEFVEEVLEIPHVVRVEEMLSAKENVRPLAVTDEAEDINRITAELDALGLTIESEQLMRYAYMQPFDHFGESVVSEE